MKALINRIIDFSNVDGPGNRLAIFFQGCQFACLYCHNPETINVCNNCGVCVTSCPTKALTLKNGKVYYDISKCVNCDTCLKVCPNLASPKAIEYSLAEMLTIIKDIKPYIRGITVSGGECMLQADFLLELFKEVKALGLTCLIDSNGAVDFSKHSELLEYSDGVMLDVKATDLDFHLKITKVSNQMVLKNLKYLLDSGKLFEVRTVLLPGFQQENLKTIKSVCGLINNQTNFKLIKYRPYGVRPEGIEVLGNKTMDDIQYRECVEYCKKQGQTKIIEV